jgi:hypothetical protein
MVMSVGGAAWSRHDVGIFGFIDPLGLFYPEQKWHAAEREAVHFPLEWNLKAQKSQKKLGSHKVSDQILQIQE